MSAFSVETVDYDYDIIENNLEFIPEKKVRHKVGTLMGKDVFNDDLKLHF